MARRRAGLGLSVLVLVSCSEEAEETELLRIGRDTTTNEIVRPVGEATSYPFVCTIRMDGGGACSGALVARNVVLTASHCVSGVRRFNVGCPYSGDSTVATGSEAEMSPTGRYSFSGGYINPERGSDVALIHLDRDIVAPRYGVVRLERVDPPLRVFPIGRINNGSFTSRLWVSPTFTVRARYGRGTPPYAVGANNGVTQPGDSGGALFDADTQEIIGTVSGGSYNTSIYGVVGAHADWFRATVLRWSGAPPGMSPPGGTPPSPTPPTPTPPGPTPPTPPGPTPPSPTPPTPTPPSPPPGGGEPCGMYEGWNIRSCIGPNEWVRCIGGRLERGTCGGRCLVRPPGYDDVCLPGARDTIEPCGEYTWINYFTCNRSSTQRVLCAHGYLLREPCAGGCVSQPPGVDDYCQR
ncbi:MAG: trypsin-like serine protease [Deltaproteobacteria bacterium]|nr:trypsin-like serine protease [Deltaproteobacteria bacterium]